MRPLTIVEIARFWSKVEVLDRGRCWEWRGRCSTNGYGRFSIGETYYGAHRVALAMHQDSHDRIVSKRSDDLVLHNCDNRRCVNPFHLRYGTALENQRDCIQRGRSRHLGSSGSRNGRSILTEDAVREIRKDTRPARVLALEYGVGISTISRVRRGEGWSSVTSLSVTAAALRARAGAMP